MRHFLAIVSMLALSLTACATDESVPSCKGVATSCALFSTKTTCIAQLGCDPMGDACTGVARPCSLLSQLTCSDQAGCLWSSSSNSCTGSAWSCDIQFDQVSCLGQDGCRWSPLDCAGDELACTDFGTADGCTGQDGCAWTP